MSDFFQQIWQIIVDSNLLNVTGAILVLLVGYLTALVIGRKSAGLIQKIAGKTVTLPDGTVVLPIARTARIFGRVVYAVIMLLAVLGCFSVLKLDAAAAPLQEFITGITAFLPNIAGALLLVFLAWVLSELVKMFVAAFLRSSSIGGKLLLSSKEKHDSEKFIVYTSKTAGCIVYLFFLPAILNALNIYGITSPLQSMFEKFLTFIPNLAAAVLILLVGLWAAELARKAAKGLVVISKIDELAGKFNISEPMRHGSTGAIIGWTVYVLIALPVVAAALTALNIDVLSRTIAGFFSDILSVSGAIAASVIVFSGAFIAGKFAAKILERFTAAWGIDRFIPACSNGQNGSENIKPSAVAGTLARITLFVLAAIVVCDIMGFEKLASLIKRFAVFGGNIIVSTIVLLIGIKLANVAAALVRGKCSVQIEYCIRAAVVIFTIALAISNLQIGSSVVETAFALMLGAFAVAFAIAFGAGGRKAAAEILEQWREKMQK